MLCRPKNRARSAFQAARYYYSKLVAAVLTFQMTGKTEITALVGTPQEFLSAGFVLAVMNVVAGNTFHAASIKQILDLDAGAWEYFGFEGYFIIMQ